MEAGYVLDLVSISISTDLIERAEERSCLLIIIIWLDNNGVKGYVIRFSLMSD